MGLFLSTHPLPLLPHPHTVGNNTSLCCLKLKVRSELGLAAHSLKKHGGKRLFHLCACTEFGRGAVAVANPALSEGVFRRGSDAVVCSVPAWREQPQPWTGNASSRGAGVSGAPFRIPGSSRSSCCCCNTIPHEPSPD